jgi:hypothetical protein
MKSYKTYSDSQYLKKEDFPEPESLTIVEVREEKVTAPGKEPKPKVVLYFDEVDKGLVLNRTNGDELFEMTGHEDPEQWVGQCVEAYNDKHVAYGGKRVGGIRLRPAKAAAVPTKERPY